MRFIQNKSPLFSQNFQAFLNDETLMCTSFSAFILLSFISIISIVNLIVIQLFNPSVFDTILSILLVSFSILAVLLVKYNAKTLKILISVAILAVQALIVLQYSETYLFRVSKSYSVYFPAGEIKVWLTFVLYFVENSFGFKLAAVVTQLLISVFKDDTYDQPWVYLNYILISFSLTVMEIQKRNCLIRFYKTSKQLKIFSFLVNKILPFGYIAIGIDDQNDKKKRQGVDLLAYNDFMRKIFELEEKDPEVAEKLLLIFKSNYLNRNKRTMSCLSIDEKKQKSILSFVLEKLDLTLKKKPYTDEIVILEEIYQQEVVYADNKAKAMDIVILQANVSTQPCVLVVINDISDRVLNFKLTSLDKFKDRFLQSVSHNLKTPLNSITGLVSLIHNMVINTEVLNYLNNIRINSDVLLFEINNILDYANYRKNSLQAAISEFSITSLLNELLALFELSIYEKKIKVARKIKLQGDIVISDLPRLKQILFNLLNNAVKFTFEGCISITVSKPSDLLIQADLLKFSIKDTGIGISPKQQQKLFKLWGSLNDEFTNTPNNEPHNSRSGAGLGLTISKHLIGLIGPEEKIYFKSTSNNGSTFIFYIYQNLNASMDFRCINKKKIEVIPSYDSSNLSLGRMTINSQYMLNSLQKPDTMGFANFSSYVMQNIRSPKRSSLINMRSSLSKGLGFCFAKENGYSLSNFSPKSKKNSGSGVIFNESDCIINKVYNTEETRKMGETLATTNPLMDVSFKINIINIGNRSTSKDFINMGIASPQHSKRVLIVDDTPFNLLVLEKFIQEIDPKASISKAFNGKEAVALFNQFKEPLKSAFDLIFMDCNMPVMDGYEASLEIKRIIEEEKLGPTPILAVTAYSGKEEENKCLNNGMDGYMSKPIHKEQFHEFYYRWAYAGGII